MESAKTGKDGTTEYIFVLGLNIFLSLDLLLC